MRLIAALALCAAALVLTAADGRARPECPGAILIDDVVQTKVPDGNGGTDYLVEVHLSWTAMNAGETVYVKLYTGDKKGRLAAAYDDTSFVLNAGNTPNGMTKVLPFSVDPLQNGKNAVYLIEVTTSQANADGSFDTVEIAQ